MLAEMITHFSRDSVGLMNMHLVGVDLTGMNLTGRVGHLDSFNTNMTKCQ